MTYLKALGFVFLIPFIVFLFYITVFRSLHIGTDYSMYYGFYLRGDYARFFDYFIILIFDFARSQGNFLIFTFIVTGLFLIFNLWAIRRISYNFFVSFTIFILSFYFFFIYNGMRQAVAISLIFMAIYYIQKKELKVRDMLRYFFFMILASLFHFSAIYLLPLFVLRFLRINRLMVIISFFLTALSYFTPFTKDIYTSLLMNFDFYVEKYEGQPNAFFSVNKEKTWVEFMPIFIQFIFLYYSLTLAKIKTVSNHFIINYYLAFLILYSGSGIEAIDRLQFYFYPSIILFYDYLIYAVNAKKKNKISKDHLALGNLIILSSVSFWFLYFIVRVLQGTQGINPNI
ncbi:EpsG family protein [Metaplanococcus flavidus]|uniref:EpsG family protein n=1 Tax=Metaplanococcus flavidus TaxID=569883 RepID=A0ABW3LDF9_9BACL